jgi:hypothetical protein
MKEQFRQIVRQKIIDGLAAPVPAFTRRDVWLPAVPGKAVAVVGMRRAGKTTLLWQVLSDRRKGGAAREGLLYFGFEDERLAGMQAKDLDLLVEEYYRLHPDWRQGSRATFFLDEIQSVPGWERFARRLLDEENVDLFLSGSSARLLSKEVATSMRGRAMEATVYPFSFQESLRHAGKEPAPKKRGLTKAQVSMLEQTLGMYLGGGGFPEAQGLDGRNRSELLRGYVDMVLFRDVVERHAVTQPVVLRWMVRQLLANAAGLFSVNRFYKDLKSQGLAAGKDTLHAYLGHLQDAFLLQSVAIASDSVRRRQVNPRKVYPIDTGLIPLFDRSGRANLGHALETAVLWELKRRGAEAGYVRTEGGYEVDFLARYPDGRQDLIQVCADLDDPKTRDREIRALLDAREQFPAAAPVLVAYNKPPVVEVPEPVKLIPAVEWFLSDSGY